MRLDAVSAGLPGFTWFLGDTWINMLKAVFFMDANRRLLYNDFHSQLFPSSSMICNLGMRGLWFHVQLKCFLSAVVQTRILCHGEMCLDKSDRMGPSPNLIDPDKIYIFFAACIRGAPWPHLHFLSILLGKGAQRLWIVRGFMCHYDVSFLSTADVALLFLWPVTCNQIVN